VLGVAQARRAWLTKEQVLNTRSWSEIASRKSKGTVPIRGQSPRK